jgi:DNA-binding transcriptional MerR regulator
MKIRDTNQNDRLFQQIVDTIKDYSLDEVKTMVRQYKEKNQRRMEFEQKARERRASVELERRAKRLAFAEKMKHAEQSNMQSMS